MPLERRTDKDWNHELLLLSGHLRELEDRSGARTLPARADDDDYRMPAQERLDVVFRLLQGLPGQIRVVHRAQASRGRRSNDQPLLLRHIGQREFIGVEKPRSHGATEPLGVLRIALPRDDQVPAEQRLERAQDVAAATAGAEKKNIHGTPSCCLLVSMRNGMTTHVPSA